MSARVLLLVGVLVAACRQPNPDWLGPGVAASTEGSTSAGSSSGELGEGEASGSGGSESGGGDGSTTIGPSTNAPACLPAPELGEGACPEACTSCDEGRCRIECTGASCSDAMGACPPGWPCDMVCSGANACRDTTLECPAEGDCTVACSGANACRDAVVACGEGPCAVGCAATSNTCRDLVVQCGAAQSTVVCEAAAVGVVVEPLAGSVCACEQDGCA